MPFGTRRALGSPPPPALTYAFQDRFVTDAAAPLTTPRNAEPGPGALTIVDTNNIMSVNGGALFLSGTSAASDRLGPAATLARVAGRTFLWYWADVTNLGAAAGALRVGWDTLVNASSLTYGWDFGGNTLAQSIRSKAGTSVLDSVTIGPVPGWYAAIMRATGGLLLRRMAGSGVFTLEWVYALSSAALFHKFFVGSASLYSCRLDNWLVVDFPAPLTTDAAIATTLTASPASGASGQMTAAALVEFTWTVAAAEVLELDVRRTDADNRWIIRCDSVGGTIKLIERNGGSEQERASNSQTWTALSTYRILAIIDGASIKDWVGLSSTDALTAKNVYASATFNQGVTGIAVAGFTSGANLIAWPRLLALPGV